MVDDANQVTEETQQYFSYLHVILAVNLLAVVIWWVKSDMKTRVKDTQLSRQLTQSEERIKSLESELEHARMDILTQRRIAAELDERLTICLERKFTSAMLHAFLIFSTDLTMDNQQHLKEPMQFDLDEFHQTHRRKTRSLVLCITFLAVGCICSVMYAFVQRSKIERILDASETQRHYSHETNQASEEKIKMLEQQVARVIHEAQTQRMITQRLEKELLGCKSK
jgi:hypothetical protein